MPSSKSHGLQTGWNSIGVWEEMPVPDDARIKSPIWYCDGRRFTAVGPNEDMKPGIGYLFYVDEEFDFPLIRDE